MALRRVTKVCNFIQKYSEAFGIFYRLWRIRKNVWDLQEGHKFFKYIQKYSESLVQVLGSLEKYLGHSGRSTSLYDFFKNCKKV